MSQNSTTLYVN